MTDTRWNNPDRVPLSNGPLRATTPPAAPRVRLDEDGQLLEYLLPFPMHIIDTRPWSPMHCIIGSSPVQIHKPIPVAKFYEPQERIGNGSPDAFCSIIR